MAPAIVRRLNKTLSGRYGECARGRDLAVACDTCDVRIYPAAIVGPSFDACSSIPGRSYAYRASGRPEPLGHWNRLWVGEPLGEAAMNEAGAALLGERDFPGFCRPHEGATAIRTLRTLLAERDAEGALVFRVETDTLCYSMVRSLVRVLLLVGSDARDVACPVQILRARPRSKATSITPAHGLTLEGVEYPDPSQWRVWAEQVRARCDIYCGNDD